MYVHTTFTPATTYSLENDTCTHAIRQTRRHRHLLRLNVQRLTSQARERCLPFRSLDIDQISQACALGHLQEVHELFLTVRPCDDVAAGAVSFASILCDCTDLPLIETR